MADVTPIYAWPVPTLTDPPNGPQQITDLADAIETTINATTIVGVPSGHLTNISPNAFTTLCTVSVTLPIDQSVEVTGWAFLVNQGTGRPVVSLMIVSDPENVVLAGIGGLTMGGTNDNYGAETTLIIPRHRVGLTAGTHTLSLKAWKDGNGSVDVWDVRTLSSRALAVTGIEATY